MKYRNMERISKIRNEGIIGLDIIVKLIKLNIITIQQIKNI